VVIANQMAILWPIHLSIWRMVTAAS